MKKTLNRALALILALCLMLSAASLAAAEPAWKTHDVPYGAKIKAGTVLYADPEMEQAAGTVKKDALVQVTETREKAAKIAFTAEKQARTAWVEGDKIQILDVATPTDLEAMLQAEDVEIEEPVNVILSVVEESPSEPVPAEPEPEDAPAAVILSVVEESPSEPVPAEPEPEDTPAAVILSVVEESPSEPVPAEPEPEDTPAAVILSVVEESPSEPVPAEPEPEEAPLPASYAGLLEETEYIELALEDDEDSPAVLTPEELRTSSIYSVDEDGTITLEAASSYETPNLPEIRSQNPYGACWAFAAIGGMEIELIRRNDASTSIDLSEFFLAYFATHNYPDPKPGGAGDSMAYVGNGIHLDTGGNSVMATHILASLIGLTTEKDNPYPAGGQDADTVNAIAPDLKATAAAQLVSAMNIPATSTSEVKAAIQKYGSVRASVNMPRNGGNVYNPETYGLYGTDKGTNHDVLLVGWDDMFPASSFRPSGGAYPAGNGAWRARNSWGSGFGDSGYFWISYYDASLNAGTVSAFDAETSDIPDYVYSYDRSYQPTHYYYTVTDKATVTQTFTMDGGEILKSVGYETAGDNQTLQAIVKIGDKEVSRSNVVDAPYAGFYLLKLNTAYPVNNRSAVTVEIIHTSKASGGSVKVSAQVEAKITSRGSDGAKVEYVGAIGSEGFLLNGRTIQGDSTIKLYTKQQDVSGLVSSVSLNRTTATLNSGETVQLTAAISPANAVNSTLRWVSSDEDVARVDQNGRVTGGEVRKPGGTGTAVITAMSSNGKSASCEVRVNHKDLPVRAVKIKGYDSTTARIDDNSGGIKIGDRMVLEAQFTPENTYQRNVKWSTDNSAVISIVKQVDNTCEVLIRKNGNATIKVESQDNPALSAYVNFTVYLPVHVTSVSLNYAQISLWEKQTGWLTATVLPKDAEDKTVTWSSSDTRVVTVSQSGEVTGVRDGTAVITVTTRDKGLQASCVVIVATRDPVEAFIYRMYRICLLRDPDPVGFSHWVNQLKTRAMTGAVVGFHFFDSDEMKNRNLPDADYLERLYEGFMGRGSDPTGRQFWLERLEAGMSRNAVVAGFISSQEFTDICNTYGIDKGSYTSPEPRDQNYGVTAFTSRLYTKMLGRDFDLGGLNFWCERILKKPVRATLLQVALTGFMHSDEFLNKNLNDTEFLKVLYRTFLGREFDQGGLEYWLSKMAAGMTRDKVAEGFAASQEFAAIMANYGFVK